jgi:hypothetical protein
VQVVALVQIVRWVVVLSYFDKWFCCTDNEWIDQVGDSTGKSVQGVQKERRLFQKFRATIACMSMYAI